MQTYSSIEILDRLKEAISLTTDTELAEFLGVKKATLSNWRSRNSIDFPLLFSKCKHLNANWLLYGLGEMNDLISSEIEREVETRPRIPFDAEAGTLSMISNSISHNQCELFPIIPRFPAYDFTILVRGDSMEPEFQSGDEIACRFIDESRFIQWGRPHVLDTTQGVVLKRIYNRQNSILCKSDNKDYEDFEIEKQDILHIALVVGSVRIY